MSARPGRRRNTARRPRPKDADDERHPVPLHRRAGRARSRPRWQDRWDARGHLPRAEPDRSAGRAGRARAAGRSCSSWTCSRTPRGAGLHVGHPLGYIATDVYARFQRMTGHNVLHTPGLRRVRPARRAVRRADRHAPARVPPRPTSPTCSASCAGWAWATTTGAAFATIDPEFYRGPSGSSCRSSTPGTTTARRGKARPIAELVAAVREPASAPTPDGRALGRADRRRAARASSTTYRLAYVSEAPVNWCPGLGTVLANEEVTADGRSERGNFPVFKRNLRSG